MTKTAHDYETGVGQAERRKSPRAPQMDTEASLFDVVAATPTREISGMVRGSDPMTSQRGAVDVLGKRAWVKRAILEAIATGGPLTDGQLENRPEFAALGPSTVRKRRSELFQAGKLKAAGTLDKMTLWDLADA